ncbi:MAG: pyridoxal-dependent decarboxylase [Acidimicrobiales bacterium]
MDPEDFRTAGHALIDWIADFRAGIEQHPVRAQVAPGDVRSAFDPVAPTTTVGIDDLLATMDSVVVPGMTHVQHPMFFGWFPANASLASVLGDLASSGLGGLGISWESAPALTEVEQVVCEWMRQLTGLSDQWHGTIHDTASTSAVTALLVARERATDLSQNRDGLAGVDRPLVVYTTTQAHSSVAKAALLAGYGWDNIRNVDIDPLTSAMLPDALAAAMAEDLAAGRSRPW